MAHLRHPVELPLTDQPFERGSDVGPETMRFLLEPGDTLYLPRGVAHDAVATDETSLHITTGLMFRTWADVLAEAVISTAHTNPALRHALPPGFANHGYDLGAHDATFAALVDILADAPVGKLLAGFREDFMTGRVPRVEGQLAQVAALPGLTVDSRVGGRPHLIYSLADLPATDLPAADQVRLICQGAEIVMPDFARDAIAFCLATPDFRLGDMQGDLDDAGKLVLARRLVREGLMRVL